jgi:hypothetical protein
MEVTDVRRRVRAAIEQARRDTGARRERVDAASRAYDEFLAGRAVPTFNMIASALVGEGHRFKVLTPAGSVRLAAEAAPDDFIELTFDPSEDPPVVLGRANVGRGRRSITTERPVREATGVQDLTEEDVLNYVMSELPRLVARS